MAMVCNLSSKIMRPVPIALQVETDPIFNTPFLQTTQNIFFSDIPPETRPEMRLHSSLFETFELPLAAT